MIHLLFYTFIRHTCTYVSPLDNMQFQLYNSGRVAIFNYTLRGTLYGRMSCYWPCFIVAYCLRYMIFHCLSCVVSHSKEIPFGKYKTSSDLIGVGHI